jgi:hypothetical protein
LLLVTGLNLTGAPRLSLVQMGTLELAAGESGVVPVASPPNVTTRVAVWTR